MKAFTILETMHIGTAETFPATQFMTLHDRGDLSRIFGEGGKVYAIGANGIPEGLYLYLFLDVEEQRELLESLAAVADQRDGNANIVDALGATVDGITIAVINVEE